MDLNTVSLVGRLGKDPELKTVGEAMTVVNFNLAVKGRGKDETFWLPCTLWGQQAQSLAQYCTKGTKIGVSGSLRQRKYTTNSGDERTVTEIAAEHFYFVESKKVAPETAEDRSATAEQAELPLATANEVVI
jgi:single-strand DNA-binding protein